MRFSIYFQVGAYDTNLDIEDLRIFKIDVPSAARKRDIEVSTHFVSLSTMRNA